MKRLNPVSPGFVITIALVLYAVACGAQTTVTQIAAATITPFL
jgi:hypothetical protein